VGELVRVSELDEGDGILFAEPFRQLIDLAARRTEVARQRENAHEQPAARDVVAVAGEVLAEQADGVGLAVFARERRRALERRRRARDATGGTRDEESVKKAQIASECRTRRPSSPTRNPAMVGAAGCSTQGRQPARAGRKSREACRGRL